MLTRRIIYHANQEQFFDDVEKGVLVDKMLKVAHEIGFHPRKTEILSWEHNGPAIKELLKISKLKDVHLILEYAVPYNTKRIDCIFCGKGINGNDNLVHIELKQWNSNSVKALDIAGNFEEIEEDKENKVCAYVRRKYRVMPHPSQQVRGYNDYLSTFVNVIKKGELHITGLAYCYNYYKYDGCALFDHCYDKLLREVPTYAADDVGKLANKLYGLLGNGEGESVFQKLINSDIIPEKKILDYAYKMAKEGDPSTFALLDDQIVAKNIILDKMRKLKTSGKKSVIIVKGGPGTGKTVIALNILAELVKKYKAIYAVKSLPLKNGIKFKLPRGNATRVLFKTLYDLLPSKCDKDSIDILLVDEAHRIEKDPNKWYTKDKDYTELTQLEALFRVAKILVFFIDDRQPIRPTEDYTSDMIKEESIKRGYNVEELELKSQFRCNGSDNYLDWLDGVIYNENDKISFNKNDFDFKVFDSPQELYNKIVEKNSKDGQTARLTAGLCWPWTQKLNEDGTQKKDIVIGDFAMPWCSFLTHFGPPKGLINWYEGAYKPEGIKQVLNIYVVQGFEFDYVGVIIGPDLKYRNGRIEIDSDKNYDWVLKKYGCWEKYIRNSYRILMSRGMKGCYIYCVDPQTQEYFKQFSK